MRTLESSNAKESAASRRPQIARRRCPIIESEIGTQLLLESGRHFHENLPRHAYGGHSGCRIRTRNTPPPSRNSKVTQTLKCRRIAAAITAEMRSSLAGRSRMPDRELDGGTKKPHPYEAVRWGHHSRGVECPSRASQREAILIPVSLDVKNILVGLCKCWDRSRNSIHFRSSGLSHQRRGGEATEPGA